VNDDNPRVALSISSRSEAAAPDLPTARGVQVALDDLPNRKGRSAQIAVDLFDDEGDPERTAELAEEIVRDRRYVAVIGPMGSDEAFANAPIFNREGLLQISPCASHPDLCQRGFKTFFRLVPNERQQGQELARIATRFFRAGKIVTVADADAFGRSVSAIFREGCAALGSEVVAEAFFGRGTTDFDDVLSEVIAHDPDVVFFAVHQHEGKMVSSRLRALGVRAPFLGTDGMKTSFFLGGGDEHGDAFHTHSGADFRRLPSAAAFRDKYTARFPEDSTYSPEAYDALMLIADAFDRATEPTRAGVLEAFRSRRTYEGVTGEIAFDDSGERVGSPVSFYRVTTRDGERQMEYLGTTGEVIHAPATAVGKSL